MSVKLNKKSILKLLFILLLLQSLITYQLNDNILGKVVSYMDEIIEIVAVFYIAINYRSIKRLGKSYSTIVFICIALNMVGVISTAVYHVNDIFPTVVDFLNCSKFLVIFIAASILELKYYKMDMLFRELNGVIKCFVTILCVLTIFNILVYPIFPIRDDRAFASQMLGWRHPSEFATVVFICFLLLLYNSKYYKNFIYIVATLLLIVSAMRIRILAAAMVAMMMYFYYIKFKIKKSNLLYIGIILAVCMVGHDQFYLYYTNTDQPRYMMMFNALVIANEHFPLGVGFASFGTNMAKEYYSPLYHNLGFDYIYGFSRESGEYLNDQIWSGIMAQFGWAGLLLFVLILCCFYKLILKMKDKDLHGYVCALSIFVYELFSSLGEAAWYSPNCVLIFLIFAHCLIGTNIEHKKEVRK